MKNLLRVFIVLGCGAVVLIAEDFWAKKSYTEWTEKDAAKLLQSSPWAHDVTISFGSGGGGGMGGGGGRNRQGGAGMGDTNGGATVPSMGGGDPGGGGARGGRRQYDADVIGSAPALTLSIRWQSALPLRQAMIIARMGHEKADSEEAKKFLDQTVTTYVVALVGIPPGLARGFGSGEHLQELAKLVTLNRKDKDPIVAEAAQAGQDPKGIALFFLFPRTDEITLADKEVEFAAKFGSIDIRRKFKLKDMLIGDKLAL
jgi:hypothetical protein